jgi:hypothetical protein
MKGKYLRQNRLPIVCTNNDALILHQVSHSVLKASPDHSDRLTKFPLILA